MRRHLYRAGLVFAVAIMATASAQAQRQSLGDRVSALEQQAASGNQTQINNDLLARMEELRSEIQALRSAVEQLQHDNEQLKQRNRDQFLDIDGRLNDLEGGGAPVSASPAVSSTNANKPPQAMATEIAASDGVLPKVHGDASALVTAKDEGTAYGVAFDVLKSGQYQDAEQLFLSFLELYPNGVYAPNAIYWLGESYYAMGAYKQAEDRFNEVVATYPTHEKASGALLKFGLSQYAEGQMQAATQTLAEVGNKYPGSKSADIASEYLQRIQTEM